MPGSASPAAIPPPGPSGQPTASSSRSTGTSSGGVDHSECGWQQVPSVVGSPVYTIVLYPVGLAVLLAGLAYGAWLVHVPTSWIGFGCLVTTGVGLMGAATRLRQRT
jgi:hypothetical protein